ncbi:MAG: hypothetical protein Q9185_004449 [Variospora sp. 1 TL-2023]
MITEITTLHLQAGVDLESPESSEEGKAIHDALSRRVREEDARFAYYGQSIEEPRTAFTVVGLGPTDTQKHVSSGSLANNEVDQSPADSSSSSSSSPALQEKTEKPPATATTRVVRVKFHPNPDPSPALGNNHHPNLGVTEVVFLHFPAHLPNKADIMKSIDKMRPVVAQTSEALSLFDEWSIEHRTNEAGEKIQFYVNLLGWVDIEAHTRFQSSDDFKQNVHHLMGIQEIRLSEMHHVKFYAV